MEFTKSLIKGKLIKRYKRFFVDVQLDKEIVTAHCPNTGSMRGLLDEGNEVYLLKNDDPKRKLKYGLEIIKAQKNLVGVNTHMANKIQPIAPSPRLRSCVAEYFARLISSGALSIKNCNTLSKNRTRSRIIVVPFQSSNSSRLTEERQQTAVLSSDVGK